MRSFLFLFCLCAFLTGGTAWAQQGNQVIPANGGSSSITSCTTTGGVIFQNGTNNTGTCNSNLTYTSATGVPQISSPGYSFAAPIVTPAVSGSTTWGYTIVARQGNTAVATSAEGTTTSGTSTLTGVDFNTVSWAAVPGATAYDVFISTPANGTGGYSATVTAPTVTYNDTTGFVGSAPQITPIENAYIASSTGEHIGNVSWKDIYTLPTPSGANNYGISQYVDDGLINAVVEESSTPPHHGALSPAPNFTAGNFFAYGHGTTRATVGLNVLALVDLLGATNGINGAVITAVDNAPPGQPENWTIGTTSAAIHNSTANENFVAAYYASTTINTVPSSLNVQTDFLADISSGHKSSNIGIYSGFYALEGTHSNVGAAAKTAAYYSEDTGQGTATDFAFWARGGHSLFEQDAIGSSPLDSVQLYNATAAAAGAQQYSPAIHWQGQGWKTNATAASQNVDFRSYIITVQGAANPSGNLVIESQVNGGGYGNQLQYSTAGVLTPQEYATASNCSAVGTAASPSVASCGAAPAGQFSCATNASGATCQVNTTAVTANSEIFVFESDTTTTGTRLGVTCNTSTTVNPSTRMLASSVAATGFTVNLGTVTTNPACFSYWIVN